jgi:hypothetical protein
MTQDLLNNKTEKEIFDFIRERLSFKEPKIHLRHVDFSLFKKEHKRFDMSGYDRDYEHQDCTGECTVNNINIINTFADLGIYDYTRYLFLDFAKGNGVLFLKYYYDDEDLEFDLGGLGTTEIIYEIFKKTILSNNPKRRRTNHE